MENKTNFRIELKYCERCGGLFFRRDGARQIYCHSCAPEMAKVARGPKKQPVSVKWTDLRGGSVCA